MNGVIVNLVTKRGKATIEDNETFILVCDDCDLINLIIAHTKMESKTRRTRNELIAHFSNNVTVDSKGRQVCSFEVFNKWTYTVTIQFATAHVY